MGTAILQGVPATTLDTDFWIDLPTRRYMRVLNLCRKLGAQVRSDTPVELVDGSPVNFVDEVRGLGSFDAEYRRRKTLKWLGTAVAVLPLASIHKSKTFGGRPKDLAHLPLLKQTMRLSRRSVRNRG